MQIDKDIPYPETKTEKYIKMLDKLKVGESFSVDAESKIQYIRTVWRRLKPKKFSSRCVKDGEWRCWRIK